MRKSKKLMGGFWDNLSGYFGKKDTKPSYSSTSSYTSTSSSPPHPVPVPEPAPAPTSSSISYTSQGGRRRKMRGGKFVGYSMNDLASNAGSYSGNSTAKAHYVGGKRRTKSRRTKSRRTRRR